VAQFIGYPNRQILGVLDDAEALRQARTALAALGLAETSVEVFSGTSDAARFDATGASHGVFARLRRVMQFSLMDQLPAMAWYEAALREGKTVVAVRTRARPDTLRVVEGMKAAGGHFINRFGRFDTEEFARWRGPEPAVTDLMRH